MGNVCFFYRELPDFSELNRVQSLDKNYNPDLSSDTFLSTSQSHRVLFSVAASKAVSFNAVDCPKGSLTSQRFINLLSRVCFPCLISSAL